MKNKLFNELNSIPIYITTKKKQNRKHHKKRINKKWQKRYGFTEYELMPYYSTVFHNGVIYMSQKTYNELMNKI